MGTSASPDGGKFDIPARLAVGVRIRAAVIAALQGVEGGSTTIGTTNPGFNSQGSLSRHIVFVISYLETSSMRTTAKHSTASPLPASPSPSLVLALKDTSEESIPSSEATLAAISPLKS